MGKTNFDIVFDSIKRLQDNLFGIKEIIYITPMGAFILSCCFIDYFAGFYVGRSTRAKKQESYKHFEAYVRKFLPINYNAEELWRARGGLVHDYSFKCKFIFTTTKENEGEHLKEGFLARNGARINHSIKKWMVIDIFIEDVVKASDKYLYALKTSPSLKKNAIKRYKGLGSYLTDVTLI